VFTPAILQDPVIVLVTAGVSIPILLWLGRYTRKVGAEINSQAVLSQSEDFITDLYSSLVVIVGVTGSWLGYPVLEGISGGVISLLIIKMGLQLSWSSLLVLMDAVEKPDQLVSIVKMSESIPGVIAAKNVRMRRSGPFCFGEVTIQVGETLDVEKAHRLSHEVEDRVKESITSLESLIVHIEPVKRKKHLLAMPIDIDEEWDSKLSSHFGSAPFFIIFEVNSSIKLLHVIRNPALGLEKKKGVVVSEMLIREKVTALISDELGEGPFHILRDSYVSIYRSKGGTPISKVINSFQDELVEPRGKG
jgi:predicted Fe-Mo cluster-binding NifX family protein